MFGPQRVRAGAWEEPAGLLKGHQAVIVRHAATPPP